MKKPDFPEKYKVPKKCGSYLLEIREILKKPYNDMTKEDWLKLYAFTSVVGINEIKDYHYTKMIES